MQRSDDVAQFVQSFTGSHRYILDYLIEEVFQRQPADVQDFLLKTSILDRFTAPLCDAVVERNDSREVLLVLEQANLFIVPLDESRQWYRYHHLFADLLRHRLQTVEARDAAPLHKRASAWYEANGFPADAVRHALAGSDWERASTLILGISGTMLNSGEVTTLLNWLKALPDEVVRVRPQLCLTYGWVLILTGQLDAAESYLGQAEAVSQDVTPLLGEIIAAQAYVARARGDNCRTIELSERALSLFPPEAFAERSVVALNLGIAHWNSGNLTKAEQALTEAERAAHQSGNHYVRLIALTFLGLIQAAWGRLHQAAELFRQAIQSGGNSPAVALAHLEFSVLLYERNELEAAADHLQRGLELCQRSGNVEVQIGGYRTLARLRQAQGDASAARAVIEKAHQFARDHNLPPIMRARNAACHVQIALAQNDTATAIRWAEQVSQDADASPFYPWLGLTQARLLIAQNRKTSAAEQLEACFQTATRSGWRYGLIAVRVLQSLAAPTRGKALEFLSEALAMAQPEGFIRVFADAGEPLMPLLQDAALRGVMPEYVGKIMAAIKRKPSVTTPSPSPLVEPLSERELEVLRLVAAGLSNREIAKKLVISPGTAKTHIHNVCGKLGVRNRTEAATRAKELGLV
jgi:LuxR family maltose regulon positive regulatory protein